MQYPMAIKRTASRLSSKLLELLLLDVRVSEPCYLQLRRQIEALVSTAWERASSCCWRVRAWRAGCRWRAELAWYDLMEYAERIFPRFAGEGAP